MTDPCDVFVHLMAWQLPAFAGLCALGHLDLDIVGVDQIFSRDAEASGCNLFDRGPHRVPVRLPDEPIGLLSALPGI